jgi:predicted nucleic acid-binding protein
MIYLDTSAMVKLVVRERESRALIEWLNEQGIDDPARARTAGPRRTTREDCCTSVVGRIELIRAAFRVGDGVVVGAAGSGTTERDESDVVVAARQVLDKVDTLIMTEQVVEAAALAAPAELRTLDAIHLATVLVHRPLVTAVCVYDRLLAGACEGQGFTVVAPGAA